mmetsp:Transcript_5574/g.12256  ORF Transcript_5574/g.12256 Transcript_5574/m.12256 type:complete len:265 (+) Transcript_5574:1444-2238(+)
MPLSSPSSSPCLNAKPRQRRGRRASSWNLATSCWRMGAVSGRMEPSSSCTLLHRSMTISKAPFTNKKLSSLRLLANAVGRTNTLIDLRSLLNSSIESMLYCLPQWSLYCRTISSGWSDLRRSAAPSFSASTFSAASVGSPTRINCPSRYSSCASLHSVHTVETICRAGESIVSGERLEISPTGSYDTPSTYRSLSATLDPAATSSAPRHSPDASPPVFEPGAATVTSAFTVILFVVSVPVLSVHTTEVQPRVSTDASLRTITFR